jgi:tetratricopeptide (TPR) repeat protein
LDITERGGDEYEAALTYHQLGLIARLRRDFGAAEGWYRKSLEVTERLGEDHRAAKTYHHLGMVAEDQRDFDIATRWYQRALAIFEKLCDQHNVAIVIASKNRLTELRRGSP